MVPPKFTRAQSIVPGSPAADSDGAQDSHWRTIIPINAALAATESIRGLNLGPALTQVIWQRSHSTRTTKFSNLPQRRFSAMPSWPRTAHGVGLRPEALMGGSGLSHQICHQLIYNSD